MSRIVVPIDEGKSTNPGYTEFMSALQDTYDLHELDPTDLKWVSSVDRHVAGLPPSIVINFAQNHPNMSVDLYPMVGESPVTESDVYRTPILMRDVDRWGTTKLRDYKLNGLRGVPEEKELFSQPRSLSEIIGKLGIAVKESTPVIEAVSFIPIAPNGEFSTEFNPLMQFEGYNYYRISFIAADRFVACSHLSEGRRNVEIEDIDEKQTSYKWKPSYVPDLSEFDRLLLPSSDGHMIIMATPYEKPRPKTDLFSEGYGRRDLDLGGGMFIEGPRRGISVGDISIGRGSRSGQGSLYEGELSDSSSGNATIYHIRFLGVKPENAKSLTGGMLDDLGGTLSSYDKM